MNSIESILLSLESKCRIAISAPATKEALVEISKIYLDQFKNIKGLL